MANQRSIIGQITEELGEIGKKIVTETVKAPVDIAAQVFEKGAKTNTQQKGNTTPGEPKGPKEHTPLDEIGETSDENVKRAIARKALEYILYGKQRSQEPSVYEKKMMEEKQKKDETKNRAAASAWQSLPNTGAARKRGDLRNISKKQSGAETSRNVRQD